MAESKEPKDNENPKSFLGIPSSTIPLLAAMVGAFGLIIVALINRSTAITTTLKPIESTQTAEARLTTIAMTRQAAEVLQTSVALTQTAMALDAAVAITQTADALESYVAMTTTAQAMETFVGMTKTADALETSIAMTNQSAKTPTSSPLPPASYGGLRFGCIDTTYWYLDAGPKPEPGSCWNLSQWGLNSDAQLLRIDVDNSNAIDKTLSMNISAFKNADLSFRLVVKAMDGDSGPAAPRLAIGICEPSKLRFEHAFVYYDVFDERLASAVTINGFDNKDKYYFYNNETRNYRLELRSYDLTIYADRAAIHDPITIKRTSDTALCLNYRLPEGGSLHSVIDQIQIEKK